MSRKLPSRWRTNCMSGLSCSLDFSMFQVLLWVMTLVLRSYIGKFLVVYFDDILIYSPSREIYLSHLQSICEILRRENLYANLKKCAFMTLRVIFLGFIVSGGGVTVDPNKIKCIVEWTESTSIHEVRSFYGSITFSRRFIWGFSSIIAPIIDCIHKCELKWTKATAKASRRSSRGWLKLLLCDFRISLKSLKLRVMHLGLK